MHIGRLSASGAVYFVTFVTRDRAPWLCDASARAGMLLALRAWHEEGDGRVLAATVMPDHAHVVFEAGAELPVGRCVSRWKAQARRATGYVGEWQRDFWEHRMRDHESLEDYGLYLFLNPYRAGVCGPDRAWPGWWCAMPERFRFPAILGADGVPPREWLGWGAERFAALKTGGRPARE